MPPWQSVSVLAASPPRFSAEEAAPIAAKLFDLRGDAVDVRSERDQTFLIEDGGASGILKISNPGEDPPVLDLEADALLHVARVDLELPIARQRGGRRSTGRTGRASCAFSSGCKGGWAALTSPTRRSPRWWRRLARVRGGRRGAGVHIPRAVPDDELLALSVIPKLNVTDRGLIDVNEFAVVPLQPESV